MRPTGAAGATAARPDRDTFGIGQTVWEQSCSIAQIRT